MTCTACEASTSTGIHLCTDCTLTLEQTLDMIPDTMETAQDTIARLDVIGSGGGGGSSDPASPINLTASERRTELWEAVVAWSRWMLAEDQRAERMPSEPVEYLRASTNLIRTHDWSGDLLAELSKLHGKLVAAIDVPPDIVSIGACEAETEDGFCDAEVQGPNGHEAFRCRECGALHDVAERQQWRIAEAWHAHATLPVVVKALQDHGHDVKLRTAERWAKDGDLVSGGTDIYSRPVYTPADVLATAARMKSRRGRPRKVAEGEKVA